MPETPCQKCKAELARARALLMSTGMEDLRQALDQTLQARLAAEARVTELEGGLRDAIARLNEFLQAFEGDPDPSENDTKNLVVRLQTLLDAAVSGE